MLSKVFAVLLLLCVGIYFLASSEEDSDVSILDWLRDPASSRVEHAAQVARDRERTVLARVDEPEGWPALEELEPTREAEPGPAPLELRGDEAAVALAGAESEADLEQILAASDVRLRGVTVAPDGSPWQGVSVGARQPGGPQELAQSDERGAFELRLHGSGGALSLDLGRWVPLGGELGLGPGHSVGGQVRVLVLAPRADRSGRVVDAEGRPLADVLVQAELAFEDAPAALRDLLPPRYELRAHSDAQGRWSLAPLAELPGMRVHFELEGREALEREASELQDDGDVTLPAD